jgi:hypothetical protein
VGAGPLPGKGGGGLGLGRAVLSCLRATHGGSRKAATHGGRRKAVARGGHGGVTVTAWQSRSLAALPPLTAARRALRVARPGMPSAAGRRPGPTGALPLARVATGPAAALRVAQATGTVTRTRPRRLGSTWGSESRPRRCSGPIRVLKSDLGFRVSTSHAAEPQPQRRHPTRWRHLSSKHLRSCSYISASLFWSHTTCLSMTSFRAAGKHSALVCPTFCLFPAAAV